MTEEKQLLLKDLCARLPYGVKIEITAHNLDYEKDFGRVVIADVCSIQTAKDDDGNLFPCVITCYDKYKTQGNDVESIKPYLRPMSSMSEEEREYYFVVRGKVFSGIIEAETDWLNAHHFDYRGLIEKGLALEAPEDMY